MATPRLIVFDLDYTLWPFWIDTHHPPPYTRGPTGNIRDRDGMPVHCYPDVPAMLDNLQRQGYQMAVASRTSATKDARQVMDLLGLTKYFRYAEIYPGKKTTHFNKSDSPQLAHDLLECFQWVKHFTVIEIFPDRKVKHFESFLTKSGVPYQDMLFFDDEERNIRDISNLGVTCILADEGMSFNVLQEGFSAFKQRRNRHP